MLFTLRASGTSSHVKPVSYRCPLLLCPCFGCASRARALAALWSPDYLCTGPSASFCHSLCRDDAINSFSARALMVTKAIVSQRFTHYQSHLTRCITIYFGNERTHACQLHGAPDALQLVVAVTCARCAAPRTPPPIDPLTPFRATTLANGPHSRPRTR